MRELLGDVSGLQRSVGFRIPEGELTCVVGIGDGAWDRLFELAASGRLHPFAEIRGARHTAPSTAGDLLFHIRARRLDLCFELAAAAHRTSARPDRSSTRSTASGPSTSATCSASSTAPRTRTAGGPADAALIGDEDPAFAGGSYVIVQKYLHDLPPGMGWRWREQERIIGRTKLSDLEFPDELKASTTPTWRSTRSSTTTANERKIMRFNMPFGRVGVGEFGTYFIGYAHSP